MASINAGKESNGPTAEKNLQRTASVCRRGRAVEERNRRHKPYPAADFTAVGKTLLPLLENDAVLLRDLVQQRPGRRPLVIWKLSEPIERVGLRRFLGGAVVAAGIIGRRCGLCSAA